MDLAEERAPDGFTDVADVFAPGELEGIAARYKQVAGFDVSSVSRSASGGGPVSEPAKGEPEAE